MGYPRLDSFPLASSGMKTATGAVVRLDDECAILIDLRDNWGDEVGEEVTAEAGSPLHWLDRVAAR